MDVDAINLLPIRDLHVVEDRIVRGETLFASRNRRWLRSVFEAGVKTIVDLRTADHTERYAEMCESAGLEYVHIPMDSCIQRDRKIIESMPRLFALLDAGECFVSCQQGRHRTDIAFALYYLFHDGLRCPPLLIGHFRPDGTLRIDDIMRRMFSVLHSLTAEDHALLALPADYEPVFLAKRARLLAVNREAAQLMKSAAE